MLDRLSRIQLMIFSIITVLTVGAIAIFYLQVPAKVGIGAYEVDANFVAGGGIYGNANVTYRGVTVGRVESVGLTDNGVIAHMRLNSNAPVPENVTATVKSVSAVGEQYIDLVPPEDEAASETMLYDGSSIGQDRTAIGQDIAGMLAEADALVSSISDSRLQDVLRETSNAFNGSGPELARVIESARGLVDEANASYDQTAALIDEAGPFLDAQVRSGDDIKSIADGLARLTTELNNADPQLRDLLTTAPGAADTANAAFSGIRPNFPMLAANMANLGRVGVIYNKSIEQALVVFPALISALITVAGGVPADEGGKLDFKVDLGDPPPCSVGFVPATQIRPPADETLRDLPPDLYCKVAQNDPSVVRGARNYPCMEFPGKRAPTVQLCRDPQGYVPIGSNPWRGPPIPYGTPIEDGRNILPPNKFPNIPPQADYDPGPPVVQLPPGVPPGPGPAPHAPFPLPVPPVDGPAPAPWPFFAPPDQQVPPYGRQPATPPPPPGPPPPEAPLPAEAPAPQASGPAYATYDQNGKFVDPNGGGTGVLVAADADHRPAENWVELMLDPRQV
ncbi:MCE family protein [[Mycobacterium] burgundiense]|uniref:MCE family protein n=1 Tax=[Mycobacterium] burgundiense TaxID=3064286 RepID=A0ABN9MZ08_9MYCO|nr:MCE family protein [Mycolicibacterium sp. MU0053]CAJ1495787.1 MCE family protein [Mycolicibacterium sp. MU0053]